MYTGRWIVNPVIRHWCWFICMYLYSGVMLYTERWIVNPVIRRHRRLISTYHHWCILVDVSSDNNVTFNCLMMYTGSSSTDLYVTCIHVVIYVCRISTFSQNLVLGKGTNMAYFLSDSSCLRKLITICRHDSTVKYTTATRALTGQILKILILCEILPVYLVDRLYLSVAVVSDKYCIFGRIQGS